MISKTSKPIDEILTLATKKLESSGIESARLDVELLLAHTLDCDRSGLVLVDQLNKQVIDNYNRLLQLRTKSIPLAYIVGGREFYGIWLKVTPDVLIPRPETERLVSLAIELAETGSRVVELGTGSGAIAIALKSHRPDLRILATDISESAIKIASYNARLHKLEVEFVRADLLDGVNEPCDLLIANLPYVPSGRKVSSEVKHEPDSAIFSGLDGLDHYRRLFAQINQKTPTSDLIIEAEPEQEPALLSVAKSANLTFAKRDDFAYHFKR